LWSGGTQNGGGVEDVDIAQALTKKAATAAIRRHRKEERLRMEGKVARRKSLQDACTLENSSKKRVRERVTITQYFTTTRNFDSDPTLSSAASASTCALAAMATGLAVQDLCPREALLCLHLENPSASVDIQGSTLTSRTYDVVLVGGSEPPIVLSFESSATYLSKDNPNWHSFHDMPVIQDAADEESKEEEFLDLPLPPKKTKRNYDLTRRFQMEWSTKCPWSEMVLSHDGLLHMVKCSICTAVRGRPVIFAPKWDTTWRHGKRKSHLRNTELYAARGPTFVLEQVQGCNTLESLKKVWHIFLLVF
jgi:hypothetical protein